MPAVEKWLSMITTYSELIDRASSSRVLRSHTVIFRCPIHLYVTSTPVLSSPYWCQSHEPERAASMDTQEWGFTEHRRWTPSLSAVCLLSLTIFMVAHLATRKRRTNIFANVSKIQLFWRVVAPLFKLLQTQCPSTRNVLFWFSWAHSKQMRGKTTQTFAIIWLFPVWSDPDRCLL